MALELHAGSTNTKPITAWWDLISSDLSENELTKGLREIYRSQKPSVAELILDSYCPSNCLHCIYPQNYHHFNTKLSGSEWMNILRKLYLLMGFRKFVFSGRSLTKKDLEIIRFFRNEFSDISLGIVGTGATLGPLAREIIQVAPDWIDVSVDGLEDEHNFQRNDTGAFQETIRTLQLLKESNKFKKINILTCLTTLNMDSTFGMIELLNKKGFKNFFLTPITILKGYRPDPNLVPKMENFVAMIDELISKAKGLADTWLELDIYDSIYAKDIQKGMPNIFSNFTMEDEHLEFVQENNNNEIHIVYYPSSLTGIREFIINSNGNIIPPKVMAMGKIPSELIFGNLNKIKISSNTIENLMNQRAFSFYVSEFLEERIFFRQKMENLN